MRALAVLGGGFGRPARGAVQGSEVLQAVVPASVAGGAAGVGECSVERCASSIALPVPPRLTSCGSRGPTGRRAPRTRWRSCTRALRSPDLPLVSCRLRSIGLESGQGVQTKNNGEGDLAVQPPWHEWRESIECCERDLACSEASHSAMHEFYAAVKFLTACHLAQACRRTLALIVGRAALPSLVPLFGRPSPSMCCISWGLQQISYTAD